MRIIVKSSSGLVRSFLPPVGESSMLSFISNLQAKKQQRARPVSGGAHLSYPNDFLMQLVPQRLYFVRGQAGRLRDF